jgi:hypothetical protein
MSTGTIRTPWVGIFSGIADTIYEMSGQLLTRTDGLVAAGSAALPVESVDRFPAAGRLAVADAIVFYTGTALGPPRFTGITDEDGNPGLPVDVNPRSVVTDISRLNTQMDDLRASFIVETAEDRELDIIGRNYGLPRPRGLPDSQWRLLLQQLIYIEAQTLYALEQVLDILWGPGGYTLYEDLQSYPHTVFVGLPQGGSTTFRGRAFLVGGEPQPSTGPNTVDVDNPPREVYGVYADTDVNRTGTNYANALIPYTTNAANPQRITTAGLWQVADLGRPVVIDLFSDAQHWKIQAVLDPNTVEVAWDTQNDGTTDGATPARFRTDTAWFPAWVETTPTELVVVSGANAGTYPVNARISQNEIASVGAGFVTDTDIEWYLRPALTTGGGTLAIPRATAVGNTITTPQAIPPQVLVDYVHVPSAQAMIRPGVDGERQYPFYLWDDGAITRIILDLITAAGVQVVLVPEP